MQRIYIKTKNVVWKYMFAVTCQKIRIAIHTLTNKLLFVLKYYLDISNLKCFEVPQLYGDILYFIIITVLKTSENFY